MLDEQHKEDGHEFNVLQYVELVRKHLQIIIIAGVLGAMIGLLLYAVKTPLYSANAKMHLDPAYIDTLSFGESRQSQISAYYFRTEYLRTEFQVMRSRPVVDRVIDALGQPYFEKKMANMPRSGNLLSLILGHGKQDQSTNLDQSEGAQLRRREQIRGMLLGNINISEVRQTNLVRISYTSPDPEMCRDVANAWVSAYIQHGLFEAKARNFEAFQFITTQLVEMRGKVEDLVARRTALEKENNIVKLSGNTTVDDEAVTSLNERILQQETNVRNAESALKRLRASNPDTSIEVNNTPIIKDMARRLAEKQSEYDSELQVYKRELPRMKQLDSEITSLREQLREKRLETYSELVDNYTAEINVLSNDLADLRAEFQSQRDRTVDSRKGLETRIRALDLEIEAHRDLIKELNLRKEDFDMAVALKDVGRTGKAMLEPATIPGGPFAPSLKKYLVLGLMVGFLLAVAIVFLIEITDRKIHNSEHLHRLTRLPTLAIVPYIRQRVLEKASEDFKAAALSKVAELAPKLRKSLGESDELRQMERIATEAGKDDSGAESVSKRRSRDLGKVAALANRAIQTGSPSKVLEGIAHLSSYAQSLSSQAIQNSEPISNKEKAKKKRFFKNAAPEHASEDVAYGELASDLHYGVRKVVGCFTHLKPTSPFSESYRHLRTNIQLSNTRHQKIYLVTSSVPGEGKTISSINLAIVFSQLKKSVLLVDGDLRRAKLHKVFKTSNEQGLVNYLVGNEEIWPYVQHTFVPYLDLLPAGPTPPNPAELLASDKMNDLTTQLRERYDYIIFDSSPVLAVTDACILGNMVDATLFVAKAGVTNRDDIARTLQILSANNIRPIGTLFNDLERSKRMGLYRGYRYQYQYGYSYGYTAKEY